MMRIVFKAKELDVNQVIINCDNNGKTLNFSFGTDESLESIKEFFSDSSNLVNFKIYNSDGERIFISDEYIYLQHLSWTFPDVLTPSSVSITLANYLIPQVTNV